MMDVSKYSLDGEWISVVVNSTRELEPFEFKVQPIVEAGFKAASKSPDELTSLAIESVIGWNLADGTDPLPCDEQTKRRYLTKFAAYMVKTVNGKEPKGPTILVGAIVEFAGSPDNFLKN
jgi:hypothetical protein